MMQDRQKLAIIHFQPLELYPPVMNMIHFLNAENLYYTITFTTNSKLATYKFATGNDRSRIFRLGVSGKKVGILYRYWSYFFFNFFTFFKLLYIRPNTIFYYETISSWPAITYKRFFKRTKLLIHYHEYTSTKQYETEMTLVKQLHTYEKKNYNLATWISHTNTHRMELFSKDNPQVKDSQKYILANYPPATWLSTQSNTSTSKGVKFVMVGSLGLDDLFLKEIVEWIELQNGKAQLDMYCIYISNAASTYLATRNPKYCKVLNGVNYYELNGILRNYDIGLILYKALTPNYIYNAPNKLFEYMLCGLQVWFPIQMQGCYPYTTDEYPAVKKIDFIRLNEIDINTVKLQREVNNKWLSTYTFEYEYKKILSALNIVNFGTQRN